MKSDKIKEFATMVHLLSNFFIPKWRENSNRIRFWVWRFDRRPPWANISDPSVFNLTSVTDLICISRMIFLCSCNYETLAWNLIFFLSNSFLFFLFWILSIDIGKKSRCTTSAEICIQLYRVSGYDLIF